MARGILISLVVIGHIEIPTFLSRFIYLFHIAALFFLSGYFSSIDVTSFRSLVSSCAKRVGKLYFFYLKYELLFLLLKNLFFKWGFYAEGVDYGGKFIRPDSFIDFMLNSGLIVVGMGREVMASAFWYFISLIFAILIFAIIRFLSVRQKLFEIKYFEGVAILLTFFLGCICNYVGIYLPRLAPALTLILPFYWGYLQSIGRISIQFNHPLLFLLSLLSLVGLSQFGSISMNANLFPNPPFFLVASFCGIYMIITLAKWIDGYCERLSQLFRYIGRRSVAVMIFHIFSFKLIFLLQSFFCQLPIENASQLLGNPEGSFFWFFLFLLAGIYLSIFILYCTEKLFSIFDSYWKKIEIFANKG